MFEKTKARVSKLEETHDNVHAVLQHVRDHREAYLVGAGCLSVGFVGGKYFQRPIEVITKPVFNNTVAPVIAPVMNNIGNQVINTVNNGSYARKIVRCVETDELWPSMSKAAEAAGHTLQVMSKHIHGHTSDLDGRHYVIEAVTAA
jgi:hypothetical protein